MEEIVRKISPGTPEPREAHSGSPEPGSRDIQVLVSAETLGGQKKRATVRNARAGGTTWEMLCDETVRLGGEDSAPQPLNYFSAGIAF